MGHKKDRFNVSLKLSGERFRVVYSLAGSEAETLAKAHDICVEQTIEFPADLVLDGDIKDHILGRIESFYAPETGRWETEISYAVETAGNELTQLLNVIFGNFSLKPGVRVDRVHLPTGMLKSFKGPRFGIKGLRKLLAVNGRPLFCTALKPLGLSSKALAQLAYEFACGGVDMIKDDHGLADQPFAPFNERVSMCAEAVAKANQETGGHCIYIPNLTAPADRIVKKARLAKEKGAGALMVAPGLIGWDAMRMLAEHENIALPIICHPALLGTFTASPQNGIAHHALFGQLCRLAGADASIFPNYDGRFPFSQDHCREITDGATKEMGHLKPIFPMPGGGMDQERIPEMLETYGKDVIFLIGGALHKMGPNLTENCKNFLHSFASGGSEPF
jgi:ribulose-bisphosphate carboxylase large chain